jgi:predicted small lipoprotein YifL
MTRIALTLALLCGLSACGADGPPTPPAAKPASSTGIAISGDARFGVTGEL